MPDKDVTRMPVTLIPKLVERPWGSNRLHDWYPAPVAGSLVGEVWLTAADCVAQDDGRTLEALAAADREGFANVAGRGFPLLVKLLYPREKLSIQVHPNDSLAQATLGQPRGKTECWYILTAQPGAEVAVGFRETLSPARLRAAIANGTLEAHMRMLSVKAGDMIFVDAGTVHGVGPGMVVLETQQYSDVTYRLYDYGRDRDLHIEAGLAAVREETDAGRVAPVVMDGFDRLVECSYFVVDRFHVAPGVPVDLEEGHRLQVLISLTEGCRAVVRGEVSALTPGHAFIVPAEAGPATLDADCAAVVIRILAPASA